MRKLNFERIAIVVIIIVMCIGFYNQNQKISDLKNVIKKLDIPIEKREGYYYDVSEIPQELLEKEIILND